jgi:biotin synthase
MDEKEIAGWLRERDPERLAELWDRADAVRRARVGGEVLRRGLVEVSNHCARSCLYCGLRAGRDMARYRMSAEEVLECCARARGRGCGTVVLQAGEDPGLTLGWVAELVLRIKSRFGLAVTLSLGERTEEELAAWKEAGADRYLLRFETSDPELFRRVHPPLPGRPSDRLALLRRIKALGYETGSGTLIGLPGQTWQSLAHDIALFAELELDMIGSGPFIPHPDTPLAGKMGEVPADVETACKVIALSRLVRPDANIPSTTALEALDPGEGRDLGLRCGANVVMPVLTPAPYRAAYEIYPGKAGAGLASEDEATVVRRQGGLMARILLIDDDEDVMTQYLAALAGSGHELSAARSAAQAREALKKSAPDVAVVDIMMDDGIPGFDLAREIHAQSPGTPILMVSSLNSELKDPMDTKTDEKLPIFKFLDKPVKGKVLVEEIGRALASRRPAKKA